VGPLQRVSPAASPAAETRRRGKGKPKPAGLLLTVAGAARALGVSPKAARRMIGKGLLPARSLGGRTVIIRAELEQFVARLPTVSSPEGALARATTFDHAAGR